MHQQSARPAPSAATFLRSADVAAILQVSPKTVMRWAKEGKLASRRMRGGHRRYARGDIESLVERLEGRAPPESA
jgi:excisionase family DNA binding protein